MVQSRQSYAGNTLYMVSFLYDSKGPEQDLKGAGLGFVLNSIVYMVFYIAVTPSFESLSLAL